MIDKFSLEAQKVISCAEAIAFEFAHTSIGSEHILLAFLRVDENILGRELGKYGVTYSSLSKKVKNLYPYSDEDPLYMEYTLELKVLLDNAVAISRKAGEEFVSLVSLGQALLKEDQGAAFDLLNKYKVNRDNLIKVLMTNQKRKSDLDNISDLHNLCNLKKDPLIGREDEIHQLINALSRRNKPNAILVGEPGVGKTAIVEEVAKMIYEGRVPSLRNKNIYELDIASTVSGTKYRGEFEEKLKKIIKKVKEDGNAILFIDEIHNIVKAGGAEGAIDASNILKPYLSRGDIQIIGATTEDEFHEAFDKDKALRRRFQIIKVEPSTSEETITILKALKGIYEKHYKLTIDDAILNKIVDLSKAIPNAYFPDKAIDILDNACVIAKDNLKEQDIVKTIESFFKIKINHDELSEVVSNELKAKIHGQDRALQQILLNLKMLEHKIYERDRPLLILMFVGPSGVGKSACAQIVGENFFGKNGHTFKIDMSSYQEYGSLTKLLGNNGYNFSQAPFVKNIKAFPHSLIILEEIEKANNEILDFFLNVFDEGYFIDGKGNKIDCTNAMFILTSNYGYDDKTLFKKHLDRDFSYRDSIMKKLNERFRYEFISRIDDIITFDHLNSSSRKVIAEDYLNTIADGLQFELGELDLDLDNEEIYNQYGARLIKRDVRKKVISKLMK